MLAAEIGARCPGREQRPARGRGQAFGGRQPGHGLLGAQIIIIGRRRRAHAISLRRAGYHARTRHGAAAFDRPDRHHLGRIGQSLAHFAAVVEHSNKGPAHLLQPGRIRAVGEDHHGNRAELARNRLVSGQEDAGGNRHRPDSRRTSCRRRSRTGWRTAGRRWPRLDHRRWWWWWRLFPRCANNRFIRANGFNRRRGVWRRLLCATRDGQHQR